MTGVYAYCIVPDGHRAPEGLEGVDAAPVRCVPVEGLRVWVSEHREAPARTLTGVLAHDRVVRAAVADDVSPLPVRFGQWFSRHEALADEIGRRADAYLDALDRVAGAMEFSVRVEEMGAEGERRGSDPTAVGEETTGRGYLEGLARRMNGVDSASPHAAEAAEALTRGLEELVVEGRLDALAPEGGGLRLTHLVRRRRADPYRARVRAVGDRCDRVHVDLFGPWPPYSFTP